MSLRVCIPTAGTGSRLGNLTRYVNKSLVGIANRPTLSHLIEQFPDDTEFVVAVGHQGHLVREFLELAYPQRLFLFADVHPFEGPGSGLGLSLLACEPHLQQPFIFLSCDTLVKEAIPAPDQNWMAYAEVADLAPYRTVAVADGRVTTVCEKGVGTDGTHKPYIGLAGIHDHAEFWAAMRDGGATAIETGEAHGLRQLLPLGISAEPFTWYDTGNLTELARTRVAYSEPDAPTILEKANEAIWFVGEQVIKFSDDQKFIANRVARVQDMLGFVPVLGDSRPHMYTYAKAQGHVLSETITLPLFEKLLAHSQTFWTPKGPVECPTQNFEATCMRFYRDKTLERVELFYKSFSRRDSTESLNGIAMPKLATLLDQVDWPWLAQGMPVRFHGDFHFENILWSPEQQRFTFLDWRQDFGGNMVAGDIYYDFAKLLHGMIISHPLIDRGLYAIDWRADDISFDFHRTQILVACERHFGQWLVAQGYDRRKVIVLTALIYLNIAALHHHPYSLLLFALGKQMLGAGLNFAE